MNETPLDARRHERRHIAFTLNHQRDFLTQETLDQLIRDYAATFGDHEPSLEQIDKALHEDDLLEMNIFPPAILRAWHTRRVKGTLAHIFVGLGHGAVPTQRFLDLTRTDMRTMALQAQQREAATSTPEQKVQQQQFLEELELLTLPDLLTMWLECQHHGIKPLPPRAHETCH